jgi:hypothetical protein
MCSTPVNEHLSLNNLAEPNQSAYRANHSTEISLLCVRAKLLENMEAGKVTCMTYMYRMYRMYGLSEAFDITCHKLLL